MSASTKKQRINSLHNTSESKYYKQTRQTKPVTESTAINSNNKHKKTQRVVSQYAKSSKKEVKYSSKKEKVVPPQKLINEPQEEASSNNPNPYLLTVADLESDREQQTINKIDASNSQMYEYKQKSPVKMQDASVQAEKTKVTLPLQLQKNLDQTIEKLKSKQESIDILNRTIQTRLVQPNESKLTGSRRLDVYEVQINFYVEKISQLQKELHQKNKIVASLTQKNVEFNTVVKNNRKLIGQNHRLKQQRQLMERQNQALKKLLLKRAEKSY